MYCWGGGRAALGAGPHVFASSVPLRVLSTVPFRAISVGNTQTCAIDVSDDAYCWGSGYGSLGIGERDTSCSFGPSCVEADTPQLVAGGLKWALLSAGNGFTCGVTNDALGYCWGDVRRSDDLLGPLGVLGSGALRGSKAPVAVAGGHRFKTIHAGVRHACGIATDGAAYCWGMNSTGQIGNGRFDLFAYHPASTGRHHTPQPVAGGLRFESMSAGETSCGVTVAKNLFCWGLNGAGLLGIGNSGVNFATVPTRVANPVGRAP
jgi:alpha-tubulin suppressor-like RCC1 family protein